MAQIPVWSLILNCITSHMTVRKYFRLSALGSWERKSFLAFCSRTEQETLSSLVGKLRQYLAVSLARNHQVFLKCLHSKCRAMLLLWPMLLWCISQVSVFRIYDITCSPLPQWHPLWYTWIQSSVSSVNNTEALSHSSWEMANSISTLHDPALTCQLKWSYPPASQGKWKPCPPFPDSNPTGCALSYSILFYSEDGCSLNRGPPVLWTLKVLHSHRLYHMGYPIWLSHLQLFFPVTFLTSTFKGLKIALFLKKEKRLLNSFISSIPTICQYAFFKSTITIAVFLSFLLHQLLKITALLRSPVNPQLFPSLTPCLPLCVYACTHAHVYIHMYTCAYEVKLMPAKRHLPFSTLFVLRQALCWNQSSSIGYTDWQTSSVVPSVSPPPAI